MKFDGKALAKQIEDEVKVRVTVLVTKPKIVSVLVGNDPASVLYTNLKKAAAQRMGIGFEICHYQQTNKSTDQLIAEITKIGQRSDVTGLMIQLPLPGDSRKDTEEILVAIPMGKDVDGLRYPESGVVPPVVRAILQILDKIAASSDQLTANSFWNKKFVVVGAKGFVGAATVMELAKRGVGIVEVERDSSSELIADGDVVISCVGQEGVIESKMVKQGAIVIDVGAPKGDMNIEVYQKASMSVEVPGGVGPVTIACLMANAVELYALSG